MYRGGLFGNSCCCVSDGYKLRFDVSRVQLREMYVGVTVDGWMLGVYHGVCWDGMMGSGR